MIQSGVCKVYNIPYTLRLCIATMSTEILITYVSYNAHEPMYYSRCSLRIVCHQMEKDQV